jgi:phage gp16-like protein
MADVGFKVSINAQDMADAKRSLSLISGGYEKMMKRAIKKTLAGVRTDMANTVYARLNIQRKKVLDGIKTWQSSSNDDIVGSVYSRGKPLNLASFIGTRQTLKGVTFKMKRGGKRVLLKHAFIAKMKRTDPKAIAESGTDYNVVFWRVNLVGTGDLSARIVRMRWGYQYAKMPKQYRLPLEAKTGLRIEDVLGGELEKGSLTKLAAERFEKNVAHETDVLLKDIA